MTPFSLDTPRNDLIDCGEQYQTSTVPKSRVINIAMNTKPVPSGEGAKIKTNEVMADDCVLIVGGGPVGLLTAAVLSFYGIPSVIIERNSNTTRYGSRLLPGKIYQKIGT